MRSLWSRLSLIVAGTVAAACGGEPGPPSPSDAGLDEPPSTDAAESGDAIDAGDALPKDGVGRACQSDADCEGFHCIRSSDDLGATGSGGPPNGYCSLDCSQLAGSRDPCTPFDALCVNFAGPIKAPHWCIKKCQYGKNVKCHGRTDVACVIRTTPDDPGACIPMCGSDADCTGRKCSEITSLCLDISPLRAPLYSACVAGGRGNQCAGECLPFDNLAFGQTAPGYCSRQCSIDAPHACGSGAGAPISSGTVGWCLGALPSAGAGDLGRCLQFCDTVTDCLDKDPGTTCNPAFLDSLGHGFCLPPRVVDAGAADGGSPDAPLEAEASSTSDAAPDAMDAAPDAMDATPDAENDGGD